MTGAFFKLEQMVNSIVRLINDGGGLTVIEWHSQGGENFSHRSCQDENMSSFIRKEEIESLITQIEPKDSSFLDSTTINQLTLMNSKFLAFDD